MCKPIITTKAPFSQGNSTIFSIEELKKSPVWLASNPDKKPVSAITGNIARWSDPKELTTFEDVERFISGRDGFLPAFIIYKAHQLVFIDLDHCYQSDQLTPLAQQLLTHTGNSFAEKSRSGNGLHILIQGEMPIAGIKTHDIEIYSDKKVVTLTFDYLDGRKELEKHQALIDQFIADHAPKEEPQEEDAPPTMETSQVIEKVKSLPHYKILLEEGFNPAMQEQYKGDHSSADFALMCQIAKYTRNEEQAVEVFERSQLWTPEREIKKGGVRYLKATFQKAKSKTKLEDDSHKKEEAEEEKPQRKVPIYPYFFIDKNLQDGKQWVFAQPAIDEKTLNYILIGSSREALAQMPYEELKKKFEGDEDAVLPDAFPICSEIHKSSVMRSEDKNQHSIMVYFPTYEDGHSQQLTIPTGDLHTEPNSIINLLCSRGLYIKHGLSKHVISYLNSYRPEDKGLLTDKIGWHSDTYILPDQQFGELQNIFVDDRKLMQSEHLHAKGSFEDWQEHIGKYVIGNPALIFAIGISFAPVLMHDLNIESGGFHFFGDSSTGKTTMLTIANSVWAGTRWRNTWRSTDNGLEGLCSSHNDAFMALDEIGQCAPEVVGKSVYMIANETAKLRANRKGELKEIKNWRLLFASDGELSVERMIRDFANRVNAGQLVRLLDIPLQFEDSILTEEGTSAVYHNIYDFLDINDFSKHFYESCSKYYGTPIRKFLTWYSNWRKAENRQELKKNYQSCLQILEKHCKEKHGSCSAQVRRGLERFSLILLTLCLLAEEQILKIPINQEGIPKECIDSVLKVFELWIRGRGTTASTENKQILEQTKLFIDRYSQTSKFIDYDSEVGGINHSEILGFRRQLEKETEWYLTPEVFKNILCKEIGAEAKKVVAILKKEGILKTQEGRNTSTGTPKSLGKKGRYYILTDAILGNRFEEDGNRYE